MQNSEGTEMRNVDRNHLNTHPSWCPVRVTRCCQWRDIPRRPVLSKLRCPRTSNPKRVGMPVPSHTDRVRQDMAHWRQSSHHTQNRSFSSYNPTYNRLRSPAHHTSPPFLARDLHMGKLSAGQRVSFHGEMVCAAGPRPRRGRSPKSALIFSNPRLHHNTKRSATAICTSLLPLFAVC